MQTIYAGDIGTEIEFKPNFDMDQVESAKLIVVKPTKKKVETNSITVGSESLIHVVDGSIFTEPGQYDMQMIVTLKSGSSFHTNIMKLYVKETL